MTLVLPNSAYAEPAAWLRVPGFMTAIKEALTMVSGTQNMRIVHGHDWAGCSRQSLLRSEHLAHSRLQVLDHFSKYLLMSIQVILQYKYCR